MSRELKIFAAMAAVFLVAYFLPLSNPEIKTAILNAFMLLQWYVREHTLACVVPALFIAGAITTFLSQASVIKYMGPRSNKFVAYSVASVSGAILAVCSCSVLPIFAGIFALGAGLGPATAFLYSGPAINVLAVFLTARVLGFHIGAGRAAGAVAFAFLVGMAMAAIFSRSEKKKIEAEVHMPEEEGPRRPLWKTALYFVSMVAFLVFSDWYNPGDVVVHTDDGVKIPAVVIHKTRGDVVFQLKEPWGDLDAGDKVTMSKDRIDKIEDADTWVIAIHRVKWYLAGACGLAVAIMVWRWFRPPERKQWMRNTWGFSKRLVPLLFGGVFVVGFVGHLLPEKYVAGYVGDNSLLSNAVASVIGAFWYFATLTEVPICEALGKMGMHDGPMLALLLAGPALSLPNMLVIRSVMGNLRTLVFVVLVVVIATASGMVFGTFF